MKNNKNKLKKIDKILNILIIILLITSILLILAKITIKTNNSTDDKLITELHNYFKSDDLESCNGLFNYTDKKVTYEKINPESRVCIAFQKANIPSNVEIVEYKSKKKTNICKVDKMIFRKNDNEKNCKVQKIDKNIIDKEYFKIFNRKIENNKKFYIDNQHICYLKDNYYYCGLSEKIKYIIGNNATVYRVIQKVKNHKNREEIEIDDYFIMINHNNCYQNYTTSLINKKCNDKYKKDQKINYNFMRKYGTRYKHIYKKTNYNTYYWFSTEPIK